MKTIVSVSLGSSTRDHESNLVIFNEPVSLKRIGVDGDFKKAIELVKNLDGKVDGIGLGGIDIYLYTLKSRFTIRDAMKIKDAAKITPVADGSGIKNSVERDIVNWYDKHIESINGKKVFLVSAVDRIGMAEEFVRLGAEVIFGDLISSLGLPIPLRSLKALEFVAEVTLPIITRLPFNWFYPTGQTQLNRDSRFEDLFFQQDLIAGDWHYINKFLPECLEEKSIITNTVTKKDIDELRKRKLKRLVTTTPNLENRSFGTNVIEALILAFAQKKSEDISRGEMLEWFDKFKFEKFVIEF